MEARAAAIREGERASVIWLLEHPPLYTAGHHRRSQEELLNADRFPFSRPDAVAAIPIMGPGQRIVYVMLDLAKIWRDVRHFVHSLEKWVIDSLAALWRVCRRGRGTDRHLDRR